LMADRAVIMDGKLRIEGSPEVRQGNSVIESDDQKAWTELEADGAGKFSEGKWRTYQIGK
jgi:hypothetical protein